MNFCLTVGTCDKSAFTQSESLFRIHCDGQFIKHAHNFETKRQSSIFVCIFYLSMSSGSINIIINENHFNFLLGLSY